ncbi:hypothetical protein ACVWW4_000028 [Bradyrhizobium sp. LB7.1]
MTDFFSAWKGSISEFELGVLRARMLDAARSKARRGELRISVPIGYIWHREIGLGLDPDARVQEATRLIFSRFRQLGSARQAHLSLKAEGVHFPRPSDGKKMTSFEWVPIRYRNVISILKNPFYAGAYAYGKSEHRTEIVDGRARKTYGHYRRLEDCEILLRGHHEGYIDWAEFEPQPEATRRQRLSLPRRRQVRSGRPSPSRRAYRLWPMRPSAYGELHVACIPPHLPACLSLRPRQHYAGSAPVYDVRMRIPIYSGRVFRLEAGHRSDLKPATIPK